MSIDLNSFPLVSDVISCIFHRQRFKARDDIEQLLIDTILTQPIKRPGKLTEHLCDVLIGPLHCRQAARILTCKRLCTRPEKGDKKVFPDTRPQRRTSGLNDLGQVFRRRLAVVTLMSSPREGSERRHRHAL